MGRKICLVGTAPHSHPLTPTGDESWEIWACSPGCMNLARSDVWFELHRWEPGQQWFPESYVEFLNKYEGTVVMSDPQPEAVPGSVKIPWEDLVERYGPYFFTSSIAWMLAMAIDLKPEKIALFGVDMATSTEYENQRLGCQYFAQLAKSRGIEVGVPPESDLLRPAPLYGVCETSHVWIKQTARARDLGSRKRECLKIIEERTMEMHYLTGALDEQDWNLHSWQGAEDTISTKYIEPPTITEHTGPQPEDDERSG